MARVLPGIWADLVLVKLVKGFCATSWICVIADCRRCIFGQTHPPHWASIHGALMWHIAGRRSCKCGSRSPVDSRSAVFRICNHRDTPHLFSPGVFHSRTLVDTASSGSGFLPCAHSHGNRYHPSARHLVRQRCDTYETRIFFLVVSLLIRSPTAC